MRLVSSLLTASTMRGLVESSRRFGSGIGGYSKWEGNEIHISSFVKSLIILFEGDQFVQFFEHFRDAPVVTQLLTEAGDAELNLGGEFTHDNVKQRGAFLGGFLLHECHGIAKHCNVGSAQLCWGCARCFEVLEAKHDPLGRVDVTIEVPFDHVNADVVVVVILDERADESRSLSRGCFLEASHLFASGDGVLVYREREGVPPVIEIFRRPVEYWDSDGFEDGVSRNKRVQLFEDREV